MSFDEHTYQNLSLILSEPHVEHRSPENFSLIVQPVWKWQPFEIKMMKMKF